MLVNGFCGPWVSRNFYNSAASAKIVGNADITNFYIQSKIRQPCIQQSEVNILLYDVSNEFARYSESNDCFRIFTSVFLTLVFTS